MPIADERRVSSGNGLLLGKYEQQEMPLLHASYANFDPVLRGKAALTLNSRKSMVAATGVLMTMDVRLYTIYRFGSRR
jgi:hypothetical protein